MAQDMAKGRRTEIEFMNGFIAEKGAEVGVAAPTHAMLTEVVMRVERGEIACRSGQCAGEQVIRRPVIARLPPNSAFPAMLFPALRVCPPSGYESHFRVAEPLETHAANIARFQVTQTGARDRRSRTVRHERRPVRASC